MEEVSSSTPARSFRPIKNILLHSDEGTWRTQAEPHVPSPLTLPNLIKSCQHTITSNQPHAGTWQSHIQQGKLTKSWPAQSTCHISYTDCWLGSLSSFYCMFSKVNITHFWSHAESISCATSCTRFRSTNTTWSFRFHVILRTLIFENNSEHLIIHLKTHIT